MASSAVPTPLMPSAILNFALEALDRAPVERRLVRAARHAAAPARHETLGDVALAPGVDRGVDGEKKSDVSVVDGARDMIVDPIRIAAHIKLKQPRRVGRDFRHSFEARIAHGAEHMRDAEFLRRAHHRSRARRMKTLQRPHRRQHDRQPQLAPELAHRRIDLAHVAQHPRPQRDGVERHAVSPQRGLAFRPAHDVVPVVLVEVLAGLGDDLVQVEKIRVAGRHRHGGCLLGVLLVHGNPEIPARQRKLAARGRMMRGHTFRIKAIVARFRHQKMRSLT